MKSWLCFLYIVLCAIPLFGQTQSKEKIDSLVNAYCQEELYGSAFSLMSEYSIELEKNEDFETALDYALRNCKLISDKVQFFVDYGLSLSDFYTFWKRVCALEIKLGKNRDAIETFLMFLPQLREIAPEEIPNFAYTISSAFGSYTDIDYRDSVYVLQDALDIIEKQSPDSAKVNTFVRLCNAFNSNRMFNSYEGHTIVDDKMEECDQWFIRNKVYIDRLDPFFFKDQIAQFYIQYCDILSMRARYYASEDFHKSISLFSKAASYLLSISHYSSIIPQKIASYHAYLSSLYYDIQDISKSKDFADKAYDFIYSNVVNDELCEIIRALAGNYWILHDADKALSLAELFISHRKALGYSISITDYTMLMLYNTKDFDKRIEYGELLIKQYGNSNSRMVNPFILLGDSYSQKMLILNKAGGSIEETYDCEKRALECFNNAKALISNIAEKDSLGMSNIQLANLYDYMSSHYARKKDIAMSLSFAEKSTKLTNIFSSRKLFHVSQKSAAAHNVVGISSYIPTYYNSYLEELKKVLPFLGPIEMQRYLEDGEAPLYQFPEWASWNSDNHICLSLGYNSVLLSKGLLLEYSSLPNFIYKNEKMADIINQLYLYRDSVYSIQDSVMRDIGIHEYDKRVNKTRLEFLPYFEQTLYTNWENVQSALTDEDVAIEIVGYQANNWLWSTDSIYVRYDAFIVDKSHNSPTYVNLIRQDDLLPVYENQPVSYSTDEGRTLYHKIWDTLDPYIKGKRNVYISPVGMLNLINIESLTDESGSAAFEKYNIRRLSSTRLICARYSDMPKMNRVALFGGINYDDYDFTPSIPIDSLNTRGNWAYLSSTKEEIETIKHGIENVSNHIALYSGGEATEKSLKRISHESPDILHLATHGYFIPKNKRGDIPYFMNSDVIKNIDDNLYYSGLAFANGETNWKDGSFSLEANDGVLSAYEISKLNLSNTDLVVLSACETALGDRTFDGISGLQRAFKLAGVQTIIMSLWKVDDLATSFFMKVFYEGMIETNSKREAFIHAQKLTREKFEDPYYWAAFIMLD